MQLQWVPMGSHGAPMGRPMCPNASPWAPMGPNGVAMVPPWFSMRHCGFRWSSLGFPWVLSGAPWGPVSPHHPLTGLHGPSRGPRGCPMVPMVPWALMDSPLGHHGFSRPPWVPMVSPWVLMPPPQPPQWGCVLIRWQIYIPKYQQYVCRMCYSAGVCII